MAFKKPTRNPDIYVSVKDMIEFFNIPQESVSNMIENKFLIPKRCDGEIIYRHTELMRASSIIRWMSEHY